MLRFILPVLVLSYAACSPVAKHDCHINGKTISDGAEYTDEDCDIFICKKGELEQSDDCPDDADCVDGGCVYADDFTCKKKDGTKVMPGKEFMNDNCETVRCGYIGQLETVSSECPSQFCIQGKCDYSAMMPPTTTMAEGCIRDDGTMAEDIDEYTDMNCNLLVCFWGEWENYGSACASPNQCVGGECIDPGK